MSRKELMACLLVLALPGTLGAQSQPGKKDWTTVSNLRPGQVVEITTGGRETRGLYVLADSFSLVIVDLSSPEANSSRGALADTVRRNPAQAAEAAIIEASGHRAPVRRLSRSEIERVTREGSRSSKGAIAAASIGGAILGVLGGMYAGWESDDAFPLFSIAIGVPLAAGLGTHHATRRVTREVVYEAGGDRLPLDQEGWRAVRGALPASLGGR